ncbi:MAG: alpha/beta fold hydrolase [Gammaproteobacteria bacterium]|nr:alpha/beta fold hydrolase [Gammaproteobacteria bacterium]
MQVTDLVIHASDGHPLAATEYRPEAAASGKAVVVINSAMGVKRSFYADFAAYLVDQGHVVLVYDYRGLGGSAPPTLQGCTATLEDWGELDQNALLDHAGRHWPEHKLVIAGHSVGGQIMGLNRHGDALAGMLTVGSQSGYWRHYKGTLKLGVFLLWHVFVPALSRLLGYFPSSWFGIGMNIPAGVARQWAAWGRDPDYLQGRHAPARLANYAKLRVPMLAVWISDDSFAPWPANLAMRSWYAGARIDVHTVGPETEDRDRVGHFPFFKQGVAPRAWAAIAQWLESI